MALKHWLGGTAIAGLGFFLIHSNYKVWSDHTVAMKPDYKGMAQTGKDVAEGVATVTGGVYDWAKNRVEKATPENNAPSPFAEAEGTVPVATGEDERVNDALNPANRGSGPGGKVAEGTLPPIVINQAPGKVAKANPAAHATANQWQGMVPGVYRQEKGGCIAVSTPLEHDTINPNGTVSKAGEKFVQVMTKDADCNRIEERMRGARTAPDAYIDTYKDEPEARSLKADEPGLPEVIAEQWQGLKDYVADKNQAMADRKAAEARAAKRQAAADIRRAKGDDMEVLPWNDNRVVVAQNPVVRSETAVQAPRSRCPNNKFEQLLSAVTLGLFVDNACYEQSTGYGHGGGVVGWSGGGNGYYPSYGNVPYGYDHGGVSVKARGNYGSHYDHSITTTGHGMRVHEHSKGKERGSYNTNINRHGFGYHQERWSGSNSYNWSAKPHRGGGHHHVQKPSQPHVPSKPSIPSNPDRTPRGGGFNR